MMSNVSVDFKQDERHYHRSIRQGLALLRMPFRVADLHFIVFDAWFSLEDLNKDRAEIYERFFNDNLKVERFVLRVEVNELQDRNERSNVLVYYLKVTDLLGLDFLFQVVAERIILARDELDSFLAVLSRIFSVQRVNLGNVVNFSL